MTEKCKHCDDVGWVCENHRDRPWADGGTDREDACACGAGAPCPRCNTPDDETPPRMPPGTTIRTHFDHGDAQ